MYNSLEGASVIVTGAGQGIGRDTALAFARAGARLVTADVNADTGEETSATIVADGGISTFVQCDVADENSVERLMQAAISAYGRIDNTFNNAGIQIEGTTHTADLAVQTFDRTLAVNARGVFLCMKHAIRAMVTTGGGAIVNTASTAGLRARSGSPAYVASKFAVVGMTRAAAIEYAKMSIRVNAVCPGPIRTQQTERVMAADPANVARVNALTLLGRMGTASEVEAAVLWLCSSEASFVTGQALGVDGGFLQA
jgi:NAD(P)-dependent dehydrogenase (short-subunit alcohol dehydrogenase family)